MTSELVLAVPSPESRAGEPLALTPAQARLRKMVLDAVGSPHSKRNYARALDDLFAFCASRPLPRSVLMEWRAGMEALSPSTINVRLSALRKLVGEARRAGRIGQEDAASLTDIPNISQKGTRLGNWLTREQAKELLAVPDRSTLKGKRDYVILALLVGCALRRNELAELDVETIQQREGRWVLADLEGKGRRIRTVAIPIWVKHGINAWMTAAGIEVFEAQVDLAAIGLKLGFAWPRVPIPPPSCDIARPRPARRGSWYSSCELYLELAFTGLGMAGED